MSNRSAVDTIAGYFYQFDHTILSLLKLADDGATVAVECIEDVDIDEADELTAVQCKYYAKTDYNHSVIKPAIMPMLTHFAGLRARGASAVKYRLWGHFGGGQQKLALPIDTDFLITHFLSYTKCKAARRHDTDLGLDDAALAQFLGLLVIDINASSSEDQFAEIIKLLQKQFNCSAFQAEYFYYNNALAVIRGLSTAADAANRTISRGDFLKRIDTSKVLFGEWFIARKGRSAYHRQLRREWFTELNVSPHERFFLIEIDPASYRRAELADLLSFISKKYSKLRRHETHPFCPYAYIHGVREGELRDLKADLRRGGFGFIDGHDYKGAEFDVESIQRQANHTNGIQLKFLNTLDDLATAIGAITRIRRIFEFHLREPYCELEHPSVGHTRIRIEQLADIKQII